ncbi:MAG: class I SAM-dependent rRNA methyltransferase [Gammaproteobacteria bacterium]|nr:class I SAM-dependent rRNA methyltransferase [Gammaproteobacteria bacterium]
MQTLFLRKNEERRLLAGHLWIYSNEVDTKLSPLKSFSPGELVEIRTAFNKVLGLGYINPNTLLCARLLTSNKHEQIDTDFFITRIKQALIRREMCFAKPFYRLIFSESDQLPGLIVDRFDNVLVVQLNTAGTENLKDKIVEALIHTLNPEAILLRNNSHIRTTENLPSSIETAYGEPPEQVTLEENGVLFSAAIKTGQKTGWFYDQNYNRSRLATYVKNKNVLDVFSYSGGFGITAAASGAAAVTCIDSSENALEQLQQNADLNDVSDKITTICDDAFSALKNLQNNVKLFEVIVLDPPAFIKRQKDIPAGVDAYLRLHRAAMRILQPHGILLTTSCSLHLSRDMLLDVLRQAMIKEKREMVIFEQLHQSPDHPVHPAIMETNYLKGFIAQVL